MYLGLVPDLYLLATRTLSTKNLSTTTLPYSTNINQHYYQVLILSPSNTVAEQYCLLAILRVTAASQSYLWDTALRGGVRFEAGRLGSQL